MRSRLGIAVLVLLLGHGLLSAQAQLPSQPPAASELSAYETFRAWIGSQPVELQKADEAVVFRRYAEILQAKGQSAREAASTIETIRRLGDRAETIWRNRAGTRSGSIQPNEPSQRRRSARRRSG